MDLSIMPEGMELNQKELDEFIKKNKIFRNSPLLLEKNENSDLITVSKPPTQEFFEKVFHPDGPFWNIYSELGFATRPVDTKYVAFINGQMFFLKNIADRYMSNIGPEKTLDLVNNQLMERRKPSITNLLLFLTTPFDALKQQTGTIELGFMANEAIREFEEFRRKTEEYYKHYSDESNIKNPAETAKMSLEKAVQSMTYTNLAMLSYTLKIRLKESDSIDSCESEQLSELIKQGDWNMIKESFGFYSLTPYDITKPRFREDTEELERYGSNEPPKSYPLKWRENAKYLCARYLDVERIAYRMLGEETGLGDLIYYFKTDKLDNLGDDAADKARERDNQFNSYKNIELPSKIICFRGRLYMEQRDSRIGTGIIQSTSVSAKKIVAGPAVNVNSFEDYEKCAEGSIIVSKMLSPNLTILYNKAAAVVSESGSPLAHAAVIAREMGIPCLVQAESNREIIDGQYLQVNGLTGQIVILERKPDK